MSIYLGSEKSSILSVENINQCRKEWSIFVLASFVGMGSRVNEWIEPFVRYSFSLLFRSLTDFYGGV